jgi:hypothetical protein
VINTSTVKASNNNLATISGSKNSNLHRANGNGAGGNSSTSYHM